MLKRLAAILLCAAFLGLFSSFGCARATAPLPPAEEVVLVVNRDDATLQIIPVDAPSSSNTIQLSGTNPAPAGVSALDGTALVPLGTGDAVAVIDLRSKSVTRVIPLASGSGATGSAMVDDTIGYVANPNLNTVTRVNYLTGDTASLGVGISPQAVVFTRGKVFVLNGNLSAGKPVGPSWLSVVDPLTNRLATGIDSILMPGPGNALSGDVAQDGVLYVMNAGPFDTTTQGRLTLVDPVGRSELGNFGGFGNFPGALATNGVDKLYISSLSQGLMVFDLLERQVTRGAGNGVSIPLNSGVDVDAEGRIYALESGTCGGGAAGKLHILRPDYTEVRTVTAGHCALAVLVTEIPPLAP